MSAELEEEMKMAKAKNVEKELCLSCNGSRINAVARNVRINEISIDCLSDLSVDDAIKRIEKLKFEGVQKIIDNMTEVTPKSIVESIEKELNWGAEKLRDDITCMAINIANTELIKKMK